MEKCIECQQDYGGAYCRPCNSRHFRDNFKNWTSGDDNIDKLIQESQLNAAHLWEFIEWIEYSNLKDIEHVAEGGFGSVYKAIWKDGLISYKYNGEVGYFWNINKSEWVRNGETKVAVKKYRNGTSVKVEYLNEVIDLDSYKLQF